MLSGYNAGPAITKQWQKRFKKNDLDEFWRYDGNLELLTTGCRQ